MMGGYGRFVRLMPTKNIIAVIRSPRPITIDTHSNRVWTPSDWTFAAYVGPRIYKSCWTSLYGIRGAFEDLQFKSKNYIDLQNCWPRRGSKSHEVQPLSIESTIFSVCYSYIKRSSRPLVRLVGIHFYFHLSYPPPCISNVYNCAAQQNFSRESRSI